MKITRSAKKFHVWIEDSAISSIKGETQRWDLDDLPEPGMDGKAYLGISISFDTLQTTEAFYRQAMNVGLDGYAYPEQHNSLTFDLFSMNDAYHLFNAMRRLMPGKLSMQDEIDFLAVTKLMGELPYEKIVPYARLHDALPPRVFTKEDKWDQMINIDTGEVDEDFFVPAGTELLRSGEWPFPAEMVKVVDERASELMVGKKHRRIATTAHGNSSARS